VEVMQEYEGMAKQKESEIRELDILYRRRDQVNIIVDIRIKKHRKHCFKCQLIIIYYFKFMIIILNERGFGVLGSNT
jgi:hypothetical protein